MAWLATPRTINAAGVRRRDRPGGRNHSAHSVALARGRWAVEPLPKGSAAGIRLAVRFSPHGTSKPRQPPTAACLACGPPRLQSPPVPTSFTILSHISNLCTIIPSCLACPLPAGSLCGGPQAYVCGAPCPLPLADQKSRSPEPCGDGHRHLAVLAEPLSPGNSFEP